MPAPTPQYVVYIDEAGDPGIKQKAREALESSSEWFVVSAVVMRASRDQDARDWLQDMREAVRAQSRHPLHYRKLSDSNQARVCRMLSSKDVRIFAVASHKTNMRGYTNRRLGSRMGRGEFYNWCLRLLLERVTIWCAAHSKRERKRVDPARIIFSERGGHDYTHLRAYLETLKMQAVAKTTVLRAREIVPDVIEPTLCEVRPHGALAGLQLVDIAASAFFQGTDSKSAAYTIKNAVTLKPRVACAPSRGGRADFGLLRLPFPQHGDIPEKDRPLFEAFGYRWP